MKIILKTAGIILGTFFVSACTPHTQFPKDALQRLSHPASHQHENYLAWRSNTLSKRELLDRLPHVALIGDSLSRNFYVSSVPSMAWRMATKRGRSWFLDTDPDGSSINSVYERICRLSPVVATEYASPGSYVDDGSGPESPLPPFDFSQQVTALLEQDRFPDLIILWIGHNNVNWVTDPSLAGFANLTDGFLMQARQFRQKYARQFNRLLEAARKQESRTAIVIFGEINFTSFFKARRSAEAIKRQDPDKFPHLESGLLLFPAMKPEYRDNMIRLSEMHNRELQDLARVSVESVRNSPQIRVQYVPALSQINIDKVQNIHSIDAWHPSPLGHDRLAKAAYQALVPSLQFLDIPVGN